MLKFKNKIIKLILLYILSFNYILSYNIVSINYNKEDVFTTNKKSTSYLVNISNSKPNFFHIIVESYSSYNQYVTYSIKDENCENGRNQMIMNPYGENELLINSLEIQNENKFYLCVVCQEDDQNCEFKTTIKGENELNLDLSKQYNYYISNINIDMNFNLRTTLSDDSLLSIWIKGKNPPKTTLSTSTSSIKPKSFNFGDIYLIDSNNRGKNNNYNLNIISDSGDYFVTLGSNIINNNLGKKLLINDLEYVGYLKKGTLEEVCFPLEKKDNMNDNDIIYIKGLIYTKLAKIYYKEGTKIMPLTDREIIDGNIIEAYFNNEITSDRHFCISLINNEEKYDSEEVVFSIQLISHKYINYNQFIFSPHFPGVIYSHYLLKGEIAVFSGMNTDKSAKEMKFNMKSIIGFPHMHIDFCEHFPTCKKYEEKNIEELLIPNHSNRMTVYNHYLDKEVTPLSPFQPLLIVHCLDGNPIKSEGVELCYFETSIFTDKDYVMLKEGQTYSQYLLKGEKDNYIISFEGYKKVKKIYLDLILFTGDVRFNLDQNIKAYKFYLSNKIFYSIDVDEYSTEKKVNFYVKAEKNSFYMVEYQLVFEGDESKYTNILDSGINYIESVDMSDKTILNYKILEVKNFKAYQNAPFLVNFYSQNCKFKVYREIYTSKSEPDKKYIDMYENKYGQEIIEPNDPNYFYEKYKYKIEVIKDDISEYNYKLCMIYVSGLELDQMQNYSPTETDREISVIEGVPQFFIFSEKYQTIKYAFLVKNIYDSILISLNLIDKAFYNIKVYINENVYIYEIYKTDQILVHRDDLEMYCPNDEICSIKIYITLQNKNILSRLETTIEQIHGPPIYLEKNIFKQDVLIGNNYKYYYLDIGKNDFGDITFNFKRGGGMIYGTIVKRLANTELEKADWRGLYNFPKDIKNSLKYETYLKKLIIPEDKTSECDYGCYLLLSIKTSNIREDNFNNNHIIQNFSIMTRISPKNINNDKKMPIVQIPINNFIIGNISPSNTNKIYDYYKLWIPYDSNEIYIDWQADFPSFFISIGDEMPENIDGQTSFIFNTLGHDTVIKIKKNEIIEKCNKLGIKLENENSIKDLKLIIGIWTDQADSIYTSVYAFKIFLPRYSINNEGEIIQSDVLHARGDQKIQCRPDTILKMGDILICYFALFFDQYDLNGKLTVYLQSQNPNDEVKYYAKFVDVMQVEKNNISFLIQNFPNYNKNITLSYEKTKLPYIYINEIPEGKCLLIGVETETDTIIELLSSIYNYDLEVTPNPSTAQLFSIKDEEILFNFKTTKDLLINIKSIMGGGKIYWEQEPEKKIYYLHGQNDKLSLTSGTNNQETKLSKLVISKNEDNHIDKQPNFVFYVTFYPRNNIYNIDQVKISSSVEFNYRDSTFPLDYFSKLSYSGDITISFNFYDFDSNNYKELKIQNDMIKIWGKIITEEEAYLIRSNKKNKPKRDNNSFNGIFRNPSGTLFIDKKYVDKYYEKEKNPYIFISIDTENFIYNLNSLSVELCTLLSGNFDEEEVFTPEQVYINGQNEVTYKLRVHKNKPYMIIEFATNSQYLNWVVSGLGGSDNDVGDMEEDVEKIYINGRTIYTFKIKDIENTDYIYLKIYKKNDKDKNEIDSKLCYYIFKYMSAESKDLFIDFNFKNNHLKMLKNDKNDYIININSIPCDNCDISYIIKSIPIENYNGEEILNSIAISETKGISLQLINPEINEDKTINIKLNDIEFDKSYVTILANVKQGSINEYLSYEPIKTNIIKEPTDELISIIFDSDIKDQSYSFEKANKIQKFILIFNNKENIKNYIKVESISNNNLNQILYFSTTDPNGKINRDQMAQSASGNTVSMWIKKEQFQNNDDKFYLVVECKSDTCDYTLNLYNHDFIEIESDNFIYNYYVGKNNKEMFFRIKNNIKNTDIYGKILVFYALGDNSLSLDLKNISTVNNFNFNLGKISVVEKSNNYFDDFYLQIKATEGTYINVGGRFDSSTGQTRKILEINGPEICGYLIKDILENECYLLPDFSKYENMNSFYLTGIFKNKVGEIYFRDGEYKEISDSSVEINEKYFAKNYLIKTNYIHLCVRFPQGQKQNIPYQLHLLEPKKAIGLSNIYSPQVNGKAYSRYIPKGSLVFLSGMKSNIKSKNINYHIIGTEGHTKMYIHKCTTFPECKYDYDNIESMKDIIIPNNEINTVNSWQSDNEIINSPIESEQYIMIVKCIEINDQTSDFCKFKSIIYGNEDYIDLVDKVPFSKFILKDEINNFKINFSNEIQKSQIFIDLMIISGDVSINIEDKDKTLTSYIRKYYLGNKIYYTIDLKENVLNQKIILLTVKANINSYYILNCQFVDVDAKEKNNYLYTGINYLVSLHRKMEMKKIYIERNKKQNNNLYLINFNSYNCKLNIEKGQKDKYIKINTNNDYYTQEFINNDIINYHYKITIKDEDSSNYDENMCMLFINHFEINQNSNKNDIQTEFLLNENYPQRIQFDQFKKIRYIYPHNDMSKEIEIYLKNLDHAYYSINIIYNNKENDIYYLSNDQFIFINKDNLENNCEKNKLCKIVIELTLLNKDDINVDKPMVEITLRQIENTPYYLPKGIVKKDFINGNKLLYLYTEFKKGDQGFISIDFLRGSGKIYGKIVDKDNISPETNSIWQEIKFPNEKESTLKYDIYNKKLIINSDDTQNCEKNCFILISIQSTVFGDLKDEYRIFPISILANINTDYKHLSKNKIEPDEYIVGSISLNDYNRNEFYEYYELTIPYDADVIQFELQSDLLDLYINIGADLPTKLSYDFHITSKYKDNIYELNKDEIIKVINDKMLDFTEQNSLEKINIVIGIYSEVTYSLKNNIYSLRVHIPRKIQNNIDIIKVNTDHKILCTPKKYDNNYRCLFMVLFGQDEYLNNLIVYAKSQSKKANINIYADYIDSEIYNKYDINNLSKLIPNEKARFINNDYLFLTNLEENKHLYVNVISNTPDIIEFYSSFSTYDKEVILSSNSMQIFALKNENITFSFSNIKNVIINIISLAGEGKIFWENEPDKEYSIRGRDDRLSLTSNLNSNNTKNILDDKNYKLIIKNNNYKEKVDYINDKMNYDIINTGFAFYIEYHLRMENINFDEINLGKTCEFIQRETEFPLYFYSKIDDINYDINLFIIFHNIELANKNSKNVTIINSEFDVKGALSDQMMIYKILSDNNLLKSNINLAQNGSYDSALRVAQIYITKEDIQKYKKNNNNISNLIFQINKSNNSITNEYKRISMDITVIKENSDELVTEKIYQFGKIINAEVKSYKLNIDKSSEFMRIQFSSNSDNVKYAINLNKGDKKNTTDINFITKIERGKSFITFKKPKNADYIYLNVFINDQNKDKKLNNYAFKYINADEGKFSEYPIFQNNNTIEYKYKRGYDYCNITASFKKIDKNLDITYSLKVVPVSNSLEEETMNTIAITESNTFVVQTKNPKDENGVITLNAYFKEENIRYVEIIAQIKDGPIIEYVAYEPLLIYKKDKKKSAIIIVIFSLVIFVIIMAVIIALLLLNKKNKKLLESVNKISYKESKADEKNDKNYDLLLDDNELEDEKAIN